MAESVAVMAESVAVMAESVAVMTDSVAVCGHTWSIYIYILIPSPVVAVSE